MLRSINHLDDEEPNRQEWKFVAVMPGNKEQRTSFKLHKKSWTLTMYSRECHLYATITCKSVCNEEWDIRVGIVNKSGYAIADSKAEESKEKKNTYEVHNLITGQEIGAIDDWTAELSLFVEIKRPVDDNAWMIKADNAWMIKAGERELQFHYEEMLHTGKFSDVTIKVPGKEFNCHKSILAKMSPVFEAMFEHNMKEKISGVVNIPDVNPVAFQEFLLYLYTGNRKRLSLKYADDLFTLADKYAVEELMNVCIKMKEMYSMGGTSPSELLYNYTSELSDEKVGYLANRR